MDAERRAAWWRLLVVLSVPWLALTARSWFVTDDAYIAFRYARNWAAGRGLVYNLGETPVEGFSEFLWVALSALLLKVGLDPADLAPAIGVGCGLALLGLTLSIALRLGLGEAAAGVAGLVL